MGTKACFDALRLPSLDKGGLMQIGEYSIARMAMFAVAHAGLALLLGVSAVADQRCVSLEVFVRNGAALSNSARDFVEQTYSKREGVTLVIRDVQEQTHVDRYWKLCDHFKIQKPGLPAFHISNQFQSGWDPKTTPAWIDAALTIEVFVREGCLRCEAAHPVLFERLAKRYPGYRFVERDLVTSKEAVARLQELTQRYRVQAASVPAVHLGGRLLIGFRDSDSSFQEWDRALQACTIACPVENATIRGQSPGIDRMVNTLQLASWHTSSLKQETDEPPPRPLAAPIDQQDAPPPRPLPSAADVSRSTLADPGVPDSDVVTLPLFGDIRWRDWGMPTFTLFVGLVDGFNPCAMWVLLFLLSVLVNLKDRWKILAVAGTFVVISGLAYFAFMAAWLNVFQLIGLMRPAQVTLGVIGMTIGAIHVKDFFAFHKGVSLSIPDSVKPGIYDRVRKVVSAESLVGAIFGAAVLAVLVNVIELLCTAGLPAMYTGILTLQDYPPWKNYLYLLLYIAGYMFDDALMVSAVVITLGRHKLQERGGRILKLISGLVILVLSGLMIFKPEWLV